MPPPCVGDLQTGKGQPRVLPVNSATTAPRTRQDKADQPRFCSILKAFCTKPRGSGCPCPVPGSPPVQRPRAQGGEARGRRRPSPPADSWGRIGRTLGSGGLHCGFQCPQHLGASSTHLHEETGACRVTGTPDSQGGVTQPGGAGLSQLYPSRTHRPSSLLHDHSARPPRKNQPRAGPHQIKYTP